jgi:predicted nucleic acid-binding protein
MKVGLDTNILAYAEGVNRDDQRDAAIALIRSLPDHETFVPVQALGELYNILVRKAGLGPPQARQRIVAVRDTFIVIATSPAVLMAALDLAADHRLNVWDSVMLAAAAQADCRVLLSEDMQDGFTWSGLTVVNPFALEPSPLLEQATRRGS